jgi:hypothetical protein
VAFGPPPYLKLELSSNSAVRALEAD